jgi:uncharacterized membrane protein
MHATNGVVKFVDANKVTITRSPQYGRAMIFVLNPSTERVGNVRVGSTVDIRYRQLHLEGPRIDLGEQISATDELSFMKNHPHQLPVDTRTHGDGVEGHDRPERS